MAPSNEDDERDEGAELHAAALAPDDKEDLASEDLNDAYAFEKQSILEAPDGVGAPAAAMAPVAVRHERSASGHRRTADGRASAGAANECTKWASLALLVLQNSALFVVTRATRAPERHRGRPYLASVVVLFVELLKMLICLGLLYAQHGTLPSLAGGLHKHLWLERSTTLRLGVPATCYALQNNLIFVAISNLSAAAAQVLYQLKTLSTAFFTVMLLGRSFKPAQWASFVMLALGVVLVQSQDAKSSHAPTGSSPLLGVGAALGAATLSGFAGVYLEKMFNSGSTSLWMRNVQLGLFSIPLQLIAIAQVDAHAVRRHGLMQGFHASTWLVIAIQVGGALLTAVVIKFAGNVLKTFATVLALLSTFLWSMFLFDFEPTTLFVAGVGGVSFSIYLYSRPDDAAVLIEWIRARLASSQGPEKPKRRAYARP